MDASRKFLENRQRIAYVVHLIFKASSLQLSHLILTSINEVI